MFSLGYAAIPAEGMQAIPGQLASALPADCIRFRARVASVGSDSVKLDTGEELGARAVVVACDPVTAARLLNAGEARVRTHMRPVSCFYFAANEAPIDAPYLVLNGDGSGPINNLCVPSVVAPSYAPPGMHLVSVTVLREAADEDAAPREVRAQLEDWFGPEVQRWKHLRTYNIPQALPDQSLACGGVRQSPVRLQKGLYVCGDHRASASLNGAMLTGRRAAEALAADFGGSAGLS